jgi:hypothetical protein
MKILRRSKKIETCRSISGLYAEVYFNTCAFVGIINFKKIMLTFVAKKIGQPV